MGNNNKGKEKMETDVGDDENPLSLNLQMGPFETLDIYNTNLFYNPTIKNFDELIPEFDTAVVEEQQGNNQFKKIKTEPLDVNKKKKKKKNGGRGNLKKKKKKKKK